MPQMMDWMAFSDYLLARAYHLGERSKDEKRDSDRACQFVLLSDIFYILGNAVRVGIALEPTCDVPNTVDMSDWKNETLAGNDR